MKTVGIIAEYNPFHNGHLYQMLEARKRAEADYVVVVMSGDFVQRGDPALLDKWVRARMALDAGADLVLELPVRSACASAEYFAQTGVSMLSSLGAVDAISFGYESIALQGGVDLGSLIQTDLRPLQEAAAFFSREETKEYREQLKKRLGSGLTYAKARMDAYLNMSGNEVPAELLSSPNNILAIEYLKALIRLNSSMEVIPVPRTGAGYHDMKLPGHSAAEHPASASADDPASALASTSAVFPASASAIRAAIARQEDVSAHMPDTALRLMMEEIRARRVLVPSDLDLPLHDALLRNADHLEEYLDVSPDLANRIRAQLGEYTGFESFAARLKTRQVTLTRIKRSLMHILLDLRQGDGEAQYARVLGFRRSAGELLHQISERSSIPLITKLPQDPPQALREDLFAARLWEMVVCHKTGQPVRNEYQRQIVIV